MSAERPARPMVVAHRGASIEHPENTIESFEAAIDLGADAVEFDVRMTVDGHAVVMHDPDVSRTTEGSGLVSEMTLEEIRTLGVPTLREALECLSGRAAADIEIKNSPDEPGYTPDAEPAVEATLIALDELAFSGPVIVSSFNPRSIAHSRTLRPDVPTGLLTWFDVDADEALARATGQGHPWVLPFVRKVLEAGDGFGARVHDGGALLGVWIADDPETARRLFELGADAVATNDPRTIVPVRDAAVGIVSDHTPPVMLHVALFADGEPLPGGWVAVHLGTTKKNAHGFLAGPTDVRGRVDIPRHRIEERVEDELTTSPMDYGGLEAWDGLINIEPLTRESVAGVFEAIRIWDDLGSIGTEENLEEFKAFSDTLERLSGAELTITAECEPPDAATITTSIRPA